MRRGEAGEVRWGEAREGGRMGVRDERLLPTQKLVGASKQKKSKKKQAIGKKRQEEASKQKKQA